MAAAPTAIQERMANVPDSVKAECRRAHHELGHPERRALLRLARLAGKSADHLFYLKHWCCPVCYQRQAPARLSKASATMRPEMFNIAVAVDLKFQRDIRGEQYFFLNVLDVATRYTVLAIVKNKRATTVAKKFDSAWTRWA
eukprot:3002912-Amphidinium_carterae.1